MLEYLQSYNFLIIILVSVFVITMVLPLFKRYWYAIFLIEQYLTALYDVIGECEFFGDAVDNIISPWKIALKYRYDDIHLGVCVFDSEFLNQSVSLIKKKGDKENES